MLSGVVEDVTLLPQTLGALELALDRPTTSLTSQESLASRKTSYAIPYSGPTCLPLYPLTLWTPCWWISSPFLYPASTAALDFHLSPRDPASLVAPKSGPVNMDLTESHWLLKCWSTQNAVIGWGRVFVGRRGMVYLRRVRQSRWEVPGPTRRVGGTFHFVGLRQERA